MKIMIALLLFLCAMGITGCIGRDEELYYFQLDKIIEQQVANAEGTITIDMHIDYDSIIVIHPYASEEELEQLGITRPIRKQILRNLPMHEKFQIFIVKNNQIIAIRMLGVNYGTQDSNVLVVNYPEKLKVMKLKNNQIFYDLTK
jgi:hypothetical protein